MPCGSFLGRRRRRGYRVPVVRHGRIGKRRLIRQADRPRSLKATIDALTSPKRRIEASPGTKDIQRFDLQIDRRGGNAPVLQTDTRSLQQIKRMFRRD